jgi:hypothetical protein
MVVAVSRTRAEVIYGNDSFTKGKNRNSDVVVSLKGGSITKSLSELSIVDQQVTNVRKQKKGNKDKASIQIKSSVAVFNVGYNEPTGTNSQTVSNSNIGTCSTPRTMSLSSMPEDAPAEPHTPTCKKNKKRQR